MTWDRISHAIVDSNAGPATIGDMTEEEAKDRFPDRYNQIGDWT